VSPGPSSFPAGSPYSVSSANLNKSYFTNRQDRYLHFASSPALSGYCFDFLRLFSQLSYRLLPPETSHTPFTLRWPNPNVDPTSMQAAARRSLAQFQSSQPRMPASPAVDTFVVPMIQAGYLNVREEEGCITSLFAHISNTADAHGALIDLTSGYFALHQLYQDLLIQSPASSRIIAAGPRVGTTTCAS
jgi:CDP-diacylglycerol---glycerol-3-phosphate 3-phosphatidyltransferase